jgi:hypothetical protein
MLLATTFTIYMTGLMTHVGDDRIAGEDLKRGVAIVIDGHHTPEIIIAGKYVDPTGDFQQTLVEHDRITFTGGGLIPGVAAADPRFQSYMPSLAEPFTNMLIDDDVKILARHENVSYLIYPTGKLDIACFYEVQAEFLREKDHVRRQCVPAVTQFTATTLPAERIMMTITDDQMNVKFHESLTPDAIVWIRNEPVHLDPGELRRHFMKYVGVMKRRSMFMTRQLAAVDKNFAYPCSVASVLPKCPKPPVSKLLVSEDPACTNTDWP